jgi:hypothetical protein
VTLPEGRWLFRALAAALTAALTAALMAPRPAVAHEPTSTAARVTVRSGHVELRLMLDLLPLLAEVAEPAPTQPATTQPATTQPATTQPATTQPATTQPATTQPVIAEPSLSSDAHNPPLPMTLLPLVDPPAFERRIARARRAIPDGTTLTADGRRVALALTRFPTTAELTTAARTALMAQAIEGHAHGPRVEVLLEGRLTGRPQTLTLTLPPAMGPAVVTWIEPTTQVLPVGSTARHRLRADR